MKKILILSVLLLCWATSHALPFVTTPNPSTYPIHWYKLKIAGYYLYANYTELDATQSSSSSDEYLWCFLQSNTGRIVIYNKAISKCMSNGWEFTPYLFSQSTNYVEVGSGNNFYICTNAYGSESYMQCDFGQVSFSSTGDPVTAIQALVEDYIEPTGTLVFPDPTVYDDHCTIEFDYHPSEADSGCELRLYIDGTWVSMPYSIQRTNEVQTVEATAKVIFSNPRIRTIEVTKNFEIPALDDAPQPPVTELTFTPYAFNIPHNELSNTGDEGYAKLFDKNRITKWCVVNSTGGWETISVDFKSNASFTPTGYTFTTGNDTHNYTGRNPKKWKIYAKAQESDSWTTIANVTDGAAAGLGTNNTTDYEFSINGINAKYQFFRFEVSEICGPDGWNINNYVFQLAELALSGSLTGGTVAGDVNGDGYVTSADVTAIYDVLLGINFDFEPTADVNGDGYVTSADVTEVYNTLLGNN